MNKIFSLYMTIRDSGRTDVVAATLAMEPLIIVLSTAGFESAFVLRRDRASLAVSGEEGSVEDMVVLCESA